MLNSSRSVQFMDRFTDRFTAEFCYVMPNVQSNGFNGLANSRRNRQLHKSSRPEVFCKKGVLRNFEKFLGKHLCQSLFFNKVAGLRIIKALWELYKSFIKASLWKVYKSFIKASLWKVYKSFTKALLKNYMFTGFSKDLV